MKRSELITRIALATRLIILILVVVAIIKVSKSLWEAGALLLVAFVGAFAIGICAIIVALLIIKVKN